MRSSRLGLVVVLGAAAVLRIAALATYPSGLFNNDSWGYLVHAWHDSLSGMVPPDRPVGYPLFLRVLGPGHHLLGVLVAQQLAGLAVAAVAYWSLVRLGVRRWWAVAVAGLIAFDGYAIALDQRIMPEALATILLVSSFALLATSTRPRVLVVSGLLLAAAILVRSIVVFAAPAWIAYLVARRRRARDVALAAVALAVPLLIYAAGIDVKYGRFTLNAAQGWFLYGRVGPIASCRGESVPARERSLCTDAVQRPDRWANFYIYDRRSPINAHFDAAGPYLDKHALEASGALASRFARRMIRAHPGAYARVAGGDLLRYFRPGVGSHSASSDVALTLPPHAEPPPASQLASQREVLPDYRPRAGPLAPALSRYARIFHTARWLLALAVLMSVAVLATARGPARRMLWEAWLFSGAGLGMLAGSALVAEFVLRYAVPAAPLLLMGGALSLGAVVGSRREPGAGQAAHRRGPHAAASSSSA